MKESSTQSGERMTLTAARQAALEMAPGRELQFKLRRLQTYRWGTFDDLRDIEIAPEGHLVLGPSGSGKSTLLDGHASLLTPPRWLDFNTAVLTGFNMGNRTLSLTLTMEQFREHLGGRLTVTVIRH